MTTVVEERIKAWITPGLITCFGVVSWSIISEIRSDVKSLLEANAQVKVEIQNLKERVNGIESVIYTQRLLNEKKNETVNH